MTLGCLNIAQVERVDARCCLSVLELGTRFSLVAVMNPSYFDMDHDGNIPVEVLCRDSMPGGHSAEGGGVCVVQGHADDRYEED